MGYEQINDKESHVAKRTLLSYDDTGNRYIRGTTSNIPGTYFSDICNVMVSVKIQNSPEKHFKFACAVTQEFWIISWNVETYDIIYRNDMYIPCKNRKYVGKPRTSKPPPAGAPLYLSPPTLVKETSQSLTNQATVTRTPIAPLVISDGLSSSHSLNDNIHLLHAT